MGAGGKAEGCSSCAGLCCVDTEPSGPPSGLEPVDPAVASSVGRGESSGLAIRSPPRVWDRLRSPFMAEILRVGSDRRCAEGFRGKGKQGRKVNERQAIGNAAEAWSEEELGKKKPDVSE
jgi:hypothetical protein